LRQGIANQAGYKDFRDYTHLEKNRFDYSVDDCKRFQDAVEQAVLPAATRIHERRRKQMELHALRPWDLGADPKARPPLRPVDSLDQLVERGAPVFEKVDPDFRGYFERMAAAGLLDLANRKGKAPGAYSASLHFRRMPLVFMNAVGVDDDVRTLLHECGHAFHSFEASRQPLLFQRHPGSEMAEVASMSMELLAAPFIGDFYSEDDARRSRAELLERIVLFFPHCASVDAFQQWAYTDVEGADRDARERKWLELRARFEGAAVDWSGLDRERIARWYQQPHFFSSPFYYIEYGLAQMAALQVWRNSRRDYREAVRMYRSALALAATRPLPELYGAAGARLVFDADTMRQIIDDVEEELAGLS
jgi:oligoendopeptidase F